MGISERSGATWSRVAAAVVVAVLGARAIWLAYSYLLNGAPRYRLESALIAWVIVGAIVVLSRTGEHAGNAADERRVSIAWLPISLVAAAVLYFPAFGLGPLSDDYVLREMARSPSLGVGTGWFFRPVPLVLWRVLAVGDSAVALHVLNITLHGLNGFLVAVLGVRFGLRRETALVGAALFLASPLTPEAVAWASGVQDVLMATAALGATIVATAHKRSAGQVLGVCALLVLGLGSKETAVCFPLLIVVGWLGASDRDQPFDWRLTIAIVAITVAYLVFRMSMGLPGGFLSSPSRYFVKQALTTAFGTLAIPWRLSESLGRHWLGFAAAAAVILLLTHAFVTWRRDGRAFRRAGLFSAWTLAAIAPVFTYFFVSPLMEGSRYLYLAEAAWALFVADLISQAAERVGRSAMVAIGLGTVAVLASAVVLQSELRVWRRAADLRDQVLLQARASVADHHCAAAEFTNLPDSVEGAYVFRNGFQEALRLTPNPSSAGAKCVFAWDGQRFVSR